MLVMKNLMVSIDTDDCICRVCGAEYDNKPDTIRCCTEGDE